MTKRKRYLLCGHGESLPMAEDGATSLSSVLEELAVEVCAEAVSARRRVNEEHFDFVWVSCCEGAEPINLAAACKRDSPQTAVYLVTADRTGSVTSRAQAAELDGIVSPAELGEHLLKEAARNIDGDRGDGESVALALPDSEGVRQALTTAKTQEENRAGFLLTVVSGSGGAGKSTVATLAALLGARRGLRTALLDADLQFGDLAALMGDAPSVPAEEVARTGAVPDELSGAPLVLVSAPRALERSEVVAASMGSVVDVLVASFDFVVANTGGGWDDVHGAGCRLPVPRRPARFFGACLPPCPRFVPALRHCNGIVSARREPLHASCALHVHRRVQCVGWGPCSGAGRRRSRSGGAARRGHGAEPGRSFEPFVHKH